MVKWWQAAFGLITLVWLVQLAGQPVQANAGEYVLRSEPGRNAQCLAYSVKIETDYYIIVTCRNLVYPPTSDQQYNSYILWAEGEDLKKPVKLVDLLRGTGFAKIKKPFDRLFVTLEPNNKVRAPSGPTIMQGSRQAFAFDLTPTPTPTPEVKKQANGNNRPTVTTPDQPEPGSKVSFWQSTFGKLLIIITAGFVIFIVILIIYTRRQ